MYLFAEVGHENLVASLLDFHSNFINWLILVVILFFLIRKFIPPVIVQRQNYINGELAAAAETRKKAELALAQQKQQIDEASQAVEKIVLEARQTAKQMVEELHKQTEQDADDLLKKFELAVHNERQVAVLEMRTIVAKAAIKLAKENLPAMLTENNKTKIGHEFMGELGRISPANLGTDSLKKNSPDKEEERNLTAKQLKVGFRNNGAKTENTPGSVNDKNLVDS